MAKRFCALFAERPDGTIDALATGARPSDLEDAWAEAVANTQANYTWVGMARNPTIALKRENTAVNVSDAPDESPPEDEPEGDPALGYEAMTIPQLRTYAEETGIVLPKGTKADLVAAIALHFAEAAKS